MKLFIDGNINTYYAQSLCMIFFPGAKFAQDEELTENSDMLRISIKEDETSVTATAEMRSGGKGVIKSHTELLKEGVKKEKSIKKCRLWNLSSESHKRHLFYVQRFILMPRNSR